MTKNIERGIPLPPEIVDDLTRREFLIGAGLIAIAPGCGANGEGEAGSEGDEEAMRSFEHFFGTTDIPETPERVVAADGVTFGVLAGIGVEPVGADLESVSGIGYLGSFTEGVENIGSSQGPNYEAVAALGPDLILTLGIEFNEEAYETLAQIAPTAAPAYNYVALEQSTGHWLGVADAVGRLSDGESVVADMRARIDDLSERVGARMADKPVSVLRVGVDGFYSVRFGSLESALLKAIGIPRPPNQRDPEEFALDLSMERVEDVDAWAIFLYVDQDAEEELARLEENPLWERLDAVRAGRLFTVEAGVWNGLDPIAGDLILDDIDRYLTPALNAEET